MVPGKSLENYFEVARRENTNNCITDTGAQASVREFIGRT
jgi:hypothetical protein